MDVFVGRYVKFDPEYRSYYAADNYPGPLDYEPETNLLLHNNCNGTFTDVSEKSGIASSKGRAMGVTAADFDLDGYPDIYVANDKTENFLFHNEKNGTFKEIALPCRSGLRAKRRKHFRHGSGVRGFRPGRPAGPVGIGFEVQPAHEERRQATIRGCHRAAGISQLAAQYVSWGRECRISTTMDATTSSSCTAGLIHLVPQEHSVFRNVGDGKFEDVSRAAGPFFEVQERGAAAPPSPITTTTAAWTLLHREPGRSGLPAAQRLARRGSLDFREAGGTQEQSRRHRRARVEVAAGERQRRERIAGSGYLSQDDPRVSFRPRRRGEGGPPDRRLAWRDEQVLENVPRQTVF